MAKKIKTSFEEGRKKEIAVAKEKIKKFEGAIVPELKRKPYYGDERDFQDRVTFDFPNALKQVAGGKMIQRISWDREWFGFLVNENLSLHKPDGSIVNWIVSLGDMLADDWVVIA